MFYLKAFIKLRKHCRFVAASTIRAHRRNPMILHLGHLIAIDFQESRLARMKLKDYLQQEEVGEMP